MNTRILGVITGGQLTLGLGQVERATIGLGRTGYQVDEEGHDGGNVSREEEPTVALGLDDTGNRHRAGKYNHRQH